MSEEQGLEPKAESQGISRWAKVLVMAWGAAICLPVPPLALGFCCAVLSMLGYADAQTRALSLGMVAWMVVGGACGGTMFFAGFRALTNKPSRPLRLPPLWAMIGGFVIALATGLGLWQVDGLDLLLAPWFVVTIAALPPLAALVWAIDQRPGGLARRRAGVAFSAGATVSVLLAIVLEVLVPYVVIWLLLDLGEPVLDALEGLVDVLAGDQVARALTSPGFLIALFELAVVAPLAEEFAKPLVVLPLLKKKSRRDAFLLGAAAGAGFAALENVLYALFGGRYWGGILTVRALGAAVHPIGAGLTALTWHTILNRRAGSGQRSVLRAVSHGFVPAVAQHALWNGGLALWLALSGAAFFGPAPQEADVMGIGIAVGMLAMIALEGVALWVGLRALTQRLDGAAGAEPPVLAEIPVERAVALWAIVCLVVLLPVGLAMLQALWR